MIDLDAIRERDATQFEMYHKSCHDRRALLRYVDELRAAAGKVTCKTCNGRGLAYEEMPGSRGAWREIPCPDCADLRALLAKEGA